MEFVVFISFSILIVYSLIILCFLYGWKKLKPFLYSDFNNQISISIIVACRNEDKNIHKLLKCLTKQSYPKEKTEIIIVNDHSTDNTRNIITLFLNDYPNIKLLDLPNTKNGKKEALAFGIINSNSDIIITSDADCLMGSDWLSEMIQYYIKHKPKMLAGPVSINSSSNIFNKIQTLEFLSLIGSAAGAIGINKAIMCNGANLLFEKSLYKDCNIQNTLASGDDIFLMLHAKNIDKKSIHFIKSTKAIVYTKSTKTITEFFQQRIRWTSKSKVYRDFDIIITALSVAFANLALAGSFIYSFFDQSFFNVFVLLFILKSIIDLSLLLPVTIFFRKQEIIWLFIPLQIIYPFYILVTVIFGLIGNFTWKERYFR